MSEPQIVVALRAKIGEIKGAITTYEREIAKARTSLSAVKLTLSLYGADEDTPAQVRATSREVIGLALTVLRDAPEGLSGRAIARGCSH